MKLRINCGRLLVSRMGEKESFNVPAGELCQFEGINDIKMQGGFFPEDKGRPIRTTVTDFVYSSQATKER